MALGEGQCGYYHLLPSYSEGMPNEMKEVIA